MLLRFDLVKKLGSRDIYLKLEPDFNRENLDKIAARIHAVLELAYKHEIAEMNKIIAVLYSERCQYSMIAKTFGHESLDKCGHCQYCISPWSKQEEKKTRTPLLTTATATTTTTTTAQHKAIPTNCKLLLVPWVAKYEDARPTNPAYGFVVCTEHDEQQVYHHFESLELFSRATVLLGPNDVLHEVLFDSARRIFFATLYWENNEERDERVLAFMYFLKRTLRDELNFKDCDLEHLTYQLYERDPTGKFRPPLQPQSANYETTPTTKGQLRVHLPHNLNFANKDDLDKFVRLLNIRVLEPSTQEVQTSAKLYSMVGGKIVPVYDITIYDQPVYVSEVPITRELVDHNNIENMLLGVYRGGVNSFEMGHIGRVPLTMRQSF